MPENQSTEKVVLCDKVVKTYGDFKALNDFSFSIKKGELYGLLGPNGAGKTTAIKIIIGLLRVTSGKAETLGMNPQNPKLWPRLGYMPQETALYLDLTVKENLQLFGRLYNLSKTELANRIQELLEFIDLSKWANTIVANLSGGMKHRASLAAALLPKPQLLVLDEPTVGVDPELRVTFWQRFNKMREDGNTILLTTHYMDEAKKCDRVGLIHHGGLIAEGTPQELLQKTSTESLEDAFLELTKTK